MVGSGIVWCPEPGPRTTTSKGNQASNSGLLAFKKSALPTTPCRSPLGFYKCFYSLPSVPWQNDKRLCLPMCRMQEGGGTENASTVSSRKKVKYYDKTSL